MKDQERVAIQDGRKPGWHWAANQIIDEYGPQLGPYGLALYYALCRHANQNGECWPSYATLAEETGMSPRQAIEAMKRLVELELVSKKPRTRESSDGQTSNLYTLLEVRGGAPRAQGGVHHLHRGGAPRAPEQEPFKKNHRRRENIRSKKKDPREQLLLDASEENRYRYLRGEYAAQINH